MTKKVLILGPSGKIGTHSAQAFWNAGWDVHLFDRKSETIDEAAKGVDVIINGINPAGYKDWDTIVPDTTRQIIDAAAKTKATVVIPGNVYNFGAKGGVWDENTPQKATTRKGRIRVEMENEYLKAAAKGVRTIILRAGNFINPNQNEDVMSLLLMREMKKYKLTAAGDPAAMQAYCYLPDWGKAVVQLAEKRDSLAMFEDVPFPGHSFSVNDLRSELATLLNHKVKLGSFPWLMMYAVAPFWRTANEMLEMRYLWSTDHQLSAKKFDQLLPNFKATDLATVVAAGLPAEIHPDQPVTPSAVPVTAQ